MEARFGIIPMILCMLSGIAVYVLVQQSGAMHPLQIQQTPIFDDMQFMPMPKKK